MNPEDAEAAFLVVEGEVLDDDEDFLRHVPCAQDSGIQACGAIFPTDGLTK
jgi:hypothetical protein